jgi:hypothetical protein
METEEETIQPKPIAEKITPLVQRQAEPEEEEEEPIQTKLVDGPLLQRQEEEPEEEEEEEPIQAKQAGGQTAHVGPGLHARINSMKGGGQPLTRSVRDFFEPRFGHDFSRVRVHNDAKAADTAHAVSARAFTVGRDIVFGNGQYAPDTKGGRRLMAHELAHVVQQNNQGTETSAAKVKRKIMMAGSRLWYTLWLAREWNELNRPQRRAFVKKHFQKSSKYSLAMRIIEDMAEASDRLEFEDENELLREVKKRVKTSHLMRISQGIVIRGKWRYAFGYPYRGKAKNCGPRVNEAAKKYWSGPKGHYYFTLSKYGRENAFDALQTLFVLQKNPCKRTLIHCDYLVSVLHFRAYAESLGKSEFNKRVKDGTIPMALKWNGFTDIEQSFWRSSKRESLQVVTVSKREDLIIGDHVILFNHQSYDALIKGVGGVWRLENAILVDRRGGVDLFQGHGYRGPVSELKMKKGMRAQYNKHVENVKRFIRWLGSRSADKRKKARDGLNRYKGIKKRGGEYRIIGTGFCGTPVDEPLLTPALDKLPGLNDPCNPGRLWPVRRPVESD